MNTTAGPPIRVLCFLEGLWNTEGTIFATDSAPETRLLATDKYEWLPGGHFLLHTVDARMGETVSRSIEIYGYDAGRATIVSRSYDDQGVSEDFTARLDDATWKIEGKDLRFNGEFSADRCALTGRWERRTAEGWTLLMDISLTKAA